MKLLPIEKINFYFNNSTNALFYARKIPYGNNPSAAHYVQADDAKIYFEVYGQGSPLVVLHGGGVGCTYEMCRFIDELSKNYLVIAPSQRGHGKSEIGTKKVTYEQKANDIMAVVNDVTKDPIIICGFSDGAYASYKIASMYPDRVKKIIAIGAGEIVPGMRKIPLNKLEDYSKNDANFIKEKISLCPEPEKLHSFLDDNLSFYNNIKISKEIFSTIKCPTLLIVGELDGNAPLDTVINAYKMIPNSQLAVIANCPHTVFLANFDAVWDNIMPFLNL